MSVALRARQLRAFALAAASLGLGLSAHARAHGHGGTTGSIAFAAAFCALSGWVYARRRLSAGAAAGVLLGNQLVVHATLTLSPVTAGAHEASPLEHLLPTGWMLLAHLAASAAAGASLVAIEVAWLAVTALARWIARAVHHAPAEPHLPEPRTATIAVQTVLWTSRPVGARPGRGPPPRHDIVW